MFPTEVQELLLELSPREPRTFVQRNFHGSDDHIFAGYQVRVHDVPRYYLELVDKRVRFGRVLFEIIRSAVLEDAAEIFLKVSVVGHDTIEVFALHNSLGFLAL